HHATTTPTTAPKQPYAVARSVPGPVRPVPGASVVNAPVLSAPMVTASMSSASMTPAPVIMAASVARLGRRRHLDVQLVLRVVGVRSGPHRAAGRDERSAERAHRSFRDHLAGRVVVDRREPVDVIGV